MGLELKLSEIGQMIQGSIHGNGEILVTDIAIDSRTIAVASSTMFIALIGDQHDGHDYIPELYNRGIRAFLVSVLPDKGTFPEAGFCLVENTLAGLQDLSGERRARFEGTVAAIAGSNGKTIIKEWIYQCLGGHFSVHRSPKSYNSQVGVPLSVWMMENEHDLAVIEAGISFPGEMGKLLKIIQPQVGLFTNLGTAHQENFKDLEEKLYEKLILFQGCSKIICCADQTIGSTPLTEFIMELEANLVTWSRVDHSKSTDKDPKYQYIREDLSGSNSAFKAIIPNGSFNFILPFNDDASIENALHTLTFILEMRVSGEQAIALISSIEPVSMRLEMLQGVQGSVLINDSYNSDTGGLVAALDLMDQQDHRKDKVVILSDLLQSGIEEGTLYSEIAALLERKKIDLFIGIGQALMRNKARFSDHAKFYKDTPEFLKRMDRTQFRNKTILIKGSRKFGFEGITSELQLKTHQTLLQIDLNAMVHNLHYFRARLKDHVKTMVMVKALSYGTGSVEIANLLQYHKVDYLAVAFIDEGVELRKAGINLPIMVLNPDPTGFGLMLDYRLEPEVYSSRSLEALLEVIQYRGLKGYPIHIKMDTGMHRLGFQEDELDVLMPLIKREEISVASLFSHLVASENADHDQFTKGQIVLFERMASILSTELKSKFLKHILNSAGIERFPEAQFDMVRLGIGLHGIGAQGALQPVSSFITCISQVRKVKAGESIGYSRKGIAIQDSLIATIPVGYADGLNRRLGNGAGQVWINGNFFPTIGNICMDMTMIDVTRTPVAEGELVEVFGVHQPVSQLADQAGTIPYEILTSIPERVKRVYLQE